jgi:hypothetical protein
MRSINSSNGNEGLTLRLAALIAGFGYLIGPVICAQLAVYPKLVVPSNIEQTVQNLITHRGLFLAAILCYLGRLCSARASKQSLFTAYRVVQVAVRRDRFLRFAKPGHGFALP